jgi:hypothetical protein
MTTISHACHTRGLLVSTDDWLPEDARDFHGPGLVAFIGCNSLKCATCGARVRSAAGFSSPPTLVDLLATEDWHTLPQHAPAGSGRLYACRCTVRLVRSVTPLEPDERDEFGDPDLPPWSCAGHPPLARGEEVSGLVWREDVGALARPALAAVTKLHPTVDGLPGFLAHRLQTMLPDARSRESFSRAVAAEVHDAALRPAVALFFSGWPLAPGLAEVARHASRHPEHFQGVSAGWGPFETLGDYLREGLLTSLHLDPAGPGAGAVREAYRALATYPPGLGAGLWLLPRVDPDFAAANVRPVLMASLRRWSEALGLLRPADVSLLHEAGQQLVQTGLATRERYLERLREVSPPEVVSEVEAAWPEAP